MFKTLLNQILSNKLFRGCIKQYAYSLMQLQHVAFKSVMNYFLILICINKVICLFVQKNITRQILQLQEKFFRSQTESKDVPAPIVVKEILVCQSVEVSYNCYTGNIHKMSINSSSRLCFLHQQQCQPPFFLPGSIRSAAIQLIQAAPVN